MSYICSRGQPNIAQTYWTYALLDKKLMRQVGYIVLAGVVYKVNHHETFFAGE